MAEFDDIAQVYDADFTHSEIGKIQRALVWDFFQKQTENDIKEGTSLLEMNCGTGEDALFFAKQGIFVTATDISEEMLSVVEKKVKSSAYQQNISFQKWDLTQEFSQKNPSPSFYKVAFSNFGGWNCLSAENITLLGKQLSALLTPNAKLFLVIMPRFCVWESLYFLYKRKWTQIFRRLSRKAIPAKLENVFVDTYYYSPKQIEKLLSPSFKVQAYQAVGFFVPPSYLEKFFKKMPTLLAFLNKIEKKAEKIRFFAFASDHFVMVLTKK
jgi:cyclopropane fatty-acyl-phospholipid synthase-like methyltransferase